jgi:glycine/D-amino acid oxidase-like deaminating enzyme
MGSFWLCHSDERIISSAAAVPRGLSPGYLTPPGSPIYIATPSESWSQIWDQVPLNRRSDCVFVGNGIPPQHFEDATIVVPHFAVLQVCRRGADESNNNNNNPIGTSPLSPKTFLYGKHADRASRVLEQYGVSTELVANFSDIRAAAAKKLLWASCLWLVCYSDTTTTTGSDPLTVAQAHEQRQDILDRLVAEVLPALERLLGKKIDDENAVGSYLKAYSQSIPNAIPSKELALAELKERNGVWLSLASEENPQAFHKELIGQLTGKNTLASTKVAGPRQQSLHEAPDRAQKLDLKSINLVAWGYPNPPTPKPKHISIVGGGIIGSAMALFLAQRQPECTVVVFDQITGRDVGKTTPASWAWLNANLKFPKSYQLLNQLGIHAWKHQPHISSLPAWMGSMVRFEDFPDFVNDGGYPVEGPLSNDRILELEPYADWRLNKESNPDDMSGEGFTFYFPDEGCVDPAAAVRALRQAAEGLGVQFLSGHNVTNVVRDPQTGVVTGLESQNVENNEVEWTATDLVVSAAGTGAAAPCFGGLPLLHRPGQIAFASPDEESSGRLSRILVDPLRSSHVLQRPDGSIVAGGGALEVGGSAGTVDVSPSKLPTVDNQSLLNGALQLSPSVVGSAKLTHTCDAVRPMPSDGFPIVGYVEQGLYAVVTHSGMTLGPILAALAAGEILENIRCDLLAPYRPSRFQE